jgi:hypothetical protein
MGGTASVDELEHAMRAGVDGRGTEADRSTEVAESPIPFRDPIVRAGTETRETFLVEHYRPGLTADELGAWATRVRESAVEMEREGKAVRYLRATIVPTDESLLCVIEAASEELVRQAYARAEIPFERITPVIPDGTWAEWPQSMKEEER